MELARNVARISCAIASDGDRKAAQSSPHRFPAPTHLTARRPALLRTTPMPANLCGGAGAPLRGLLLGAVPALAASLHRAAMALAPLTAAARYSSLAFAPLALAFAAAEGLFLPLAKALSAALEKFQTVASQDTSSKSSRNDVQQAADSEGYPKNGACQTADSMSPQPGIVQSVDLELSADSNNTSLSSGGEGEAALRLLLFASFLFLLLSALFTSLRFALIAFGFEASVTRIAVRNFFLLLPGLFCRQTFVFFAKLGLEKELRLPQIIAGIIGVATNLLLATVAPQNIIIWAVSFSAGYAAAFLTEIGFLCCFKAFRSLFEGCQVKSFGHDWARSCEYLLSAFALNFVEIAPYSIVFFIIARHGMKQLMTIALLLITEEAATVLTRALAVGVRGLKENDYTAHISASVLVLIVSSLQSLFIFNCSAALVHIYSDDQRVQVLYKSSLFGFLSFILMTSLMKVWRSCLNDRRLALTLLLILSRWLFRLGFGILLTLLTSKSYLFCLPIILPLGGVIEAVGVLLLFLDPCDCHHRASEEKQQLCPREKTKGFGTLCKCSVLLVSVFCITLVIYGCIEVQ